LAKSSKKKQRLIANAVPAAKGKVNRPMVRAAEAPVRGDKRGKSRAEAVSRPASSTTTPGGGQSGEFDRLVRVFAAIRAVGSGTKTSPRTQKLLASGVPKMAQKMIEEAAETAIDAVRGDRTGFINESADLLFNLVVLWSALDVAPGDVWAEMDRRERLFGIAEKLPKLGDGGGS
jgi:phosphoribosyl-ATP pyrophosphohydrolase